MKILEWVHRKWTLRFSNSITFGNDLTFGSNVWEK
jgi:hypothetical protein